MINFIINRECLTSFLSKSRFLSFPCYSPYKSFLLWFLLFLSLLPLYLLSFFLLLKHLLWFLLLPRRFYLTGDMAKLYPFIQDSLEWPLVSYFPQIYHYGINKVLIITRISNKYQMNWPYMQYYIETSQYFTDKN